MLWAMLMALLNGPATACPLGTPGFLPSGTFVVLRIAEAISMTVPLPPGFYFD